MTRRASSSREDFDAFSPEAHATRTRRTRMTRRYLKAVSGLGPFGVQGFLRDVRSTPHSLFQDQGLVLVAVLLLLTALF